MIPTAQLISVPVPRRGERYARLESRGPAQEGEPRHAEGSYEAAMPSSPGGRPATVPIGVRVPSLFTANSSTVPFVPVSA
jgi:hypothetical protein